MTVGRAMLDSFNGKVAITRREAVEDVTIFCLTADPTSGRTNRTGHGRRG